MQDLFYIQLSITITRRQSSWRWDFYFILLRASYIQGCQKLIGKKVCDNVSFSFMLFVKVLPLVVILDALKFCIESLLSSCHVLCWCSPFSFHGLSLSFSCVEVFMVSNHLYGWVEALHWSFEVYGRHLNALKLRIIQLQGLNLVRCIEIILCWIFKVSGCLLGALKFCFEAPSFFIKGVEASCWGSRVFSCLPVHWNFVLKLHVFWSSVLKLQGFCSSALKLKGLLSCALKFYVEAPSFLL